MRVLLVGLISAVGLLPPLLRADEEVSGETERLREAAQLAVYSGDLDLLQALLKAKLQINAPVAPDSGGTLLHLAVSAEKLEVVRYLMKQGANPLVRDKWDYQPLRELARKDAHDIAPMLQALERPLSDYDKTTLGGVPMPVWREVLGPAVAAPDPLDPPPPTEPAAKKLIPFILFNQGDPPKEMEVMLSSRFPGWKPASASIGKSGPHDEKVVSDYQDKQSKQPGERVEITVVAMESSGLSTPEHSPLVTYVQQHPLPAYSFKVRRTRGFLAGGGEEGHVVLISGYWVKLAVSGFEE